MTRDEVIKIINQNNGILLLPVAEKEGISRAYLSKLAKEGFLERADRGAYILSDSIHDEMFYIQNKISKSIFSHETALYFHSLTDRTPNVYAFTVPTGVHVSERIKDESKVYYIKPELYDMGIIKIKNNFGNEIKIYDAERTVCDMIRSRSRCDTQVFTDAIKKYMARENNDFNKLYLYAKKLRVQKTLEQYIEVMIWVNEKVYY